MKSFKGNPERQVPRLLVGGYVWTAELGFQEAKRLTRKLRFRARPPSMRRATDGLLSFGLSCFCQRVAPWGGGCGREDYVQCAAARLQEQNGSLLHMNSFGAIPRVERNVLACPTLKEPASL